MKYLLYPGCSLEKNAKAYLDSTLLVAKALGIDLEEVKDWNCCGATDFSSVYRIPAYALVARNLAIAESQSDGDTTLTAPCSACYLNLVKVDNHMGRYGDVHEQVNEALAAGGLHYTPGSVQVRHILDIMFNDYGPAQVEGLVKRPLKGLRVAPYYGCMILRPDLNHRWSDPEYPTEMDDLLKAAGAEVIDYPLKTHCCSGHMTLVTPDAAYEMIRELIQGAADYKADAIATLCPMCQMNLDVYQIEMNRHFHTDLRVPVLYFTQLMGLAFGASANEVGIGKEFVDARPALARIGVEAPAAEATTEPPKRRRPGDEGLPMPHLPERK
jgi:heterodisulfide reductase subunit B2